MNRSMISLSMLAAFALTSGACDGGGTPPPDHIPDMLDVLYRDKVELAVTWEKDTSGTDTATTIAHAALVMKPRSMALRFNMRTASIPPDLLATMRAGEEVTLIVENADLQHWAARSEELDGNGTRKMMLHEFLDFYVNTDRFDAMCGDTVARGYFKLKTADGVEIPSAVNVLDPIKVPVDPNLATFDWYGDDECVIEWGVPLVYGYCKTSSGNGKCEHNVDCPRIKKTAVCISAEVGGEVGHDGTTPTGSANGKWGWKYSEEQEMVPIPTYGSCGWQSDPTWDIWPYDNCQCWIDRTAACNAYKTEQTKDACKATGSTCNGGSSCSNN